MKLGLDSIKELLDREKKQLDDIEWENPSDPRIEGLLRTIRDYETRLNNGELYEPRF